jgi:hypothetical protein
MTVFVVRLRKREIVRKFNRKYRREEIIRIKLYDLASYSLGQRPDRGCRKSSNEILSCIKEGNFIFEGILVSS